MKNWWPAFSLLILLACNNEQVADQKKEEKETSEEQTTFRSDSLVQFHHFIREHNIQYAPRRYYSIGEFELQTADKEQTSESEWEPFAPLLVHNRSQQQAIDLFSKNYLIIENQGRKRLAAGEPDTELALIDFKSNTRQRILFIGPSYSIFDARWLSDTSIIAGGGELVGAEKLVPIIWSIDLSKKTVSLYRYPDTLTVSARDFLSGKYPSFDF